MATKQARVSWKGDLENGTGTIEQVGSGAFGPLAVSWPARTGDESGRIAGDVGFAVADGEPNVIKVGYTISPGFQGHGYATEAIRALVDYAFGTLGAEIVRAHASAENVPSIRVAEKVGMRLVERVEYREGDEVWHGVRYEVRR